MLRLPRLSAGEDTKPLTSMPSLDPVHGSMELAMSRPRSEYTAESALPSPGVKNTSSPSFMHFTDTSGLPSAQRSAAAVQAAASLRSDFRNFRRAGVL